MALIGLSQLSERPVWTFVKELRNRETRGQLARIGMRYLGWIGGRG